MSTTPKEPPETCRCGHGRDHHMVTAEADYTFWGWLSLFFGVSAKPTRIRYHCRRCDEVFAETTDPTVLSGDS